MNILIFGHKEMVGNVIFLYLQEKGHTVHGYDDCLHDENNIKNIINKENFDAVINCTAVINQFADQDNAEATYINSFFPHFLEKVTENMKTVVVHRSTDCIFSGRKGRYTLADTADGTSFYAKSKALGEINNNKDITIRTSLVGPEQDKDGIGLLNWFLKQHGNVNGFTNAIWTGLTTDEFARVIEHLLIHKAHGVFQTVPEYEISKFKLLQLFDKYFPGDRKLVKVDNTHVDKSLNQELGHYGLTITDYDRQIENMSKWINAHKSLYPEYYNIKNY